MLNKRTFFSFLGLLLLAIPLIAGKNITKSTNPVWVENIEISEASFSDDTENGSYKYLLIDFQDHIEEETYYRHYATKVFNTDGIQSFSDINVSFDPSYQSLSFNKLRIIRDGEVIDKLASCYIDVIQREESLERSLYDGRLTAIINLNDVRTGDVIEYAYSLKGYNPIHKGNYSNRFYMQYDFAIDRFFVRVISSKSEQVQYKLYNGLKEPIIEDKGSDKWYTWDFNEVEINLYDNNVPSWYYNQPNVIFTSYKSWKDVVNWALPLYEYDFPEIEQVAKEITSRSNLEARILDYIRMVQDDIRYLGFEDGISAFKPREPSVIFNQRYGDCKEKSLLLVSLLKHEGIEAYPMLVHSSNKDNIREELPSHSRFNHCVVNYIYKDTPYYIDPTISEQGGALDQISFPDYRYGLVLKPGTSDLIELPKPKFKEASIIVKEKIEVDSIRGSALLTVITDYRGEKADNIRSFFKSNTKEYIRGTYLDFYSGLYPSIAFVDEIDMVDLSRDKVNHITVKEYYSIPNFWVDDEDLDYIYGETYPLILSNSLDYPKSSERSMPYHLGSPFYFKQTTKFIMPEEWPIESYNRSISGDAFAYYTSTSSFGNTVQISHEYSLEKDHIDGNTYSRFKELHDEIIEEFPFYVTYNEKLAENDDISFIFLFGCLLLLVGFGFLAFKLYISYNPEPIYKPENLSIGGWLVLPTIGLVLSPFILLYTIYTYELHLEATWLGIFALPEDQLTPYLLIVVFEFIMNAAFLVYAVLLIILFFQRRTSIPILMSVFYGVNLIFIIADYLVTETFLNEIYFEQGNESLKEIFRAAFAALIWIPYFNISDRVKNTFVTVHKSVKPADEIVEQQSQVLSEKQIEESQNTELTDTKQEDNVDERLDS